MSTDQIQTKLYEKADAELRAAIKVAVSGFYKTLSNLGASGATRLDVPIGYSEAPLFKRDNTTVDWAAVKALNLDCGHMRTAMRHVLTAMETSLFSVLMAQSRVVAVDQFLADVERLKSDVEDLQGRIE